MMMRQKAKKEKLATSVAIAGGQVRDREVRRYSHALYVVVMGVDRIGCERSVYYAKEQV